MAMQIILLARVLVEFLLVISRYLGFHFLLIPNTQFFVQIYGIIVSCMIVFFSL